MLARLSFEEARERTLPALADWTDRVVPAEVSGSPSHQYSPAYAWMYAYERQLRRAIEHALGRKLGPLERALFGPGQPVSEGLSNAFVHGHRRDASLPIEVRVVVGRHGLCLAIRDQGRGFDAAAAIEALEKGRAYFRIAGNGLRALRERPDAVASFSDDGRTLLLLFPFAH